MAANISVDAYPEVVSADLQQEDKIASLKAVLRTLRVPTTADISAAMPIFRQKSIKVFAQSADVRSSGLFL